MEKMWKLRRDGLKQNVVNCDTYDIEGARQAEQWPGKKNSRTRQRGQKGNEV